MSALCGVIGTFVVCWYVGSLMWFTSNPDENKKTSLAMRIVFFPVISTAAVIGLTAFVVNRFRRLVGC